MHQRQQAWRASPTPCSLLPPLLPSAAPVVVVLSEAFISQPSLVRQLELLLRWQEAGSRAVLLPLLYGMSYEEVAARVSQFQAAPQEGPGRQQLWQRWSETLGSKQAFTTTIFHEGQVCEWSLLRWLLSLLF
jgi:hypothetical protein